MRRANQRQRQRHSVKAELAAAAEFRAALRAFLRRTAAASATHGLTPQRYDLLLQISTSDGQSTVSELSQRLALPQPAVSELVKRAELAGLVIRRRDGDDGRVSRIRLTAEAERRLMATFSELRADRRALLNTLARAGRPLRVS